jgi:uncharacterized DUF497 family protein
MVMRYAGTGYGIASSGEVVRKRGLREPVVLRKANKREVKRYGESLK